MRYLLALVLLLAGCATHTAASAPTAVPKYSECATAATTVQAYKAPGQDVSLGTEINYRLRHDPRPSEPIGWTYSLESPEPYCVVTFRASVGNEPRTYRWRLHTGTGRVEALDTETKLLSGW